jgi:hypothetical protein
VGGKLIMSSLEKNDSIETLIMNNNTLGNETA